MLNARPHVDRLLEAATADDLRLILEELEKTVAGSD
jgi:hypothetical protein